MCYFLADGNMQLGDGNTESKSLAAAIRIGAHWAGAYSQATKPISQRKPRAGKFPAPSLRSSGRKEENWSELYGNLRKSIDRQYPVPARFTCNMQLKPRQTS